MPPPPLASAEHHSASSTIETPTGELARSTKRLRRPRDIFEVMAVVANVLWLLTLVAALAALPQLQRWLDRPDLTISEYSDAFTISLGDPGSTSAEDPSRAEISVVSLPDGAASVVATENGYQAVLRNRGARPIALVSATLSYVAQAPDQPGLVTRQAVRPLGVLEGGRRIVVRFPPYGRLAGATAIAVGVLDELGNCSVHPPPDAETQRRLQEGLVMGRFGFCSDPELHPTEDGVSVLPGFPAAPTSLNTPMRDRIQVRSLTDEER